MARLSFYNPYGPKSGYRKEDQSAWVDDGAQLRHFLKGKGLGVLGGPERVT